MIKRLFYFGVLLVLLCNCTYKNTDKQAGATNDSIMKYLAIARNDTLDFKVRDKYNDKAFSLVDLKKNGTLTRYYLSSISYNYMRTKKIDAYVKIAEEHFRKSIKANDSLNIARYYRYKAQYFINLSINDSAFYYLVKTEKLHKKFNEKELLQNIFLNKGIIQYKVGDYTGSEISLLKAYSKYKNSKNKDKLYDTLNQLGLLYNDLSEYNKSMFYHKKALETVKEYNFKNIIHQDAVCYNNIGYLYLNQQKYNIAIDNFELGLKNKNIINDDIELYALLKSNLAYSKFKNKDYESTIKLLSQTLKLRKKLIGKAVLINIYIYLSEYYEEIGENKLALKYANESLKEAKKNDNELSLLYALKQTIRINKDNSKDHIEEYIKINDSIQVLERKARNNFARIQFETYEITQEKEMAIKQKWIISSIAGLIILIAVFLLVIYWQRSKQKELELIQSQQKANEEIYDLMLAQKNKEELARQGEKTRIAIELHDGVMNRLASTRLNLGILFHKNDEQTIQKCINEIDGIYEIEQEIRHIAHDLKSEVFNEKNSFLSLLKEFVVTQNTVTNTNYQLENDELIDWNSISSSIKMNLYRIIQEACNNINKFAVAKTAIIRFVLDDRNLCLSITDNGKGFDPKTNSEGIGLKNIKQRVESLKGEFVITSKKNKKTTLNIIFSIK